MIQFPFFIYGTLLPGQPNYFLWEDSIVSLQPARLVGAALYDLDWYPMLADSPGNEVVGLVMTVDPLQYQQVMSRLDYLEGYDPAEPDAGDYQRRRRIVTLSGGSQMVAWVYVGRLAPDNGRPRIESNWIAYARQRPQLAEWWQVIQTVAGRGTGEDAGV